MDFRLGNLRRDRASVLVDVYVGEDTRGIGCIDLLGPGIVTINASERPLTEGLVTQIFDLARRFAKRNEAEIARLSA